MANDYFVGTFLPPLSFETRPEISLAALDVLLRDQLTTTDYEKTGVIRQFYDILNLRALWLDQELDPQGELNGLELSEALVSRSGLPDDVYEFIDRYPKKEDCIRHFPYLLATFFQRGQHIKDPLLRRYFCFERELRLVMTAFRAHQLGRDLKVELQYEDPEEEWIAQLLAQQGAKIYEPPETYKEIKTLFETSSNNPLALQKAIDHYRFEKIEDFVDMGDIFSIKRILAYFIQLMIVEKWFELDKEKGMRIVETIVRL